MIACSIALSWIAAAATAMLLALLGEGVDRVAAGGRMSQRGVLECAVLAVIAGAGVGVGQWLSQWAASSTERRLRQAVMSRVLQMGPTGTRRRTGALLSMATTSVERTAHYRAGFLGPIVGSITTPLLVLTVMAVTISPGIALRLAALIVLVPLAIGSFRRLVRPVGAAYRRSQARLTAAFLEALQGLDTLVYARAAGRTAAQLAHRGEQHRRSLMRLLAGNQLLILVVDAAFSLTVVVAGGVLAVARVSSGRLSVGQGIAVVLMTILVIGPVDVVGQFFYIGVVGRAHQAILRRHLETGRPASRGGTATGASPRVPTAAGRSPRDSTAAGRSPRDSTAAGDRSRKAPATGGSLRAPTAETTSPDPRRPALELDDVSASWTPGRPVLTGVSIRVDPGETVALVGPSGIGKSTLSALVQGHLTPASGTVRVDGMDTRTTDPRELRSRLAVVEQRPFLFLGTIADNLRMAAPKASEADLWAALGVAGLAEEVGAMPLGLQTPVGERGRTLSGGQAQRLAIARVALRDAPILILDEPTSEVDLAAEAQILAALRRLAEGRTVLLIAHRPQAILSADRVINLAELQEGR
ncbi:ABC transporter ATP-binding protein/permease [Acidipropionibacterium jensenii]|uniref:ABC transporter ATP-binding protein/permease n=2 Tax=Acidipropionibacterium jensenii TaxID=1749 RepID=UPI002647CBFE|nr:ABC transporter ATP-binding protein [Acidipropionibacterium jensenii]MDN6556240.1 ABC transporter ATP-binding protein/permease [Acidipropionibacterium acidipropionici]MDN5977931.1 ABC transporter ATP-binding protein/permease [Acidipropionibacterium jensenii]MDN5996904.1 ABC transporter ATP-binding protein/permease [Acidipropionibacterium jensenii]MDN6427297.1 ABC transporter ATP-binding protein/permease [Acidipropionibacterium jensenii]MDN6441173.1 ABC transporter ATP-binding protein/permea